MVPEDQTTAATRMQQHENSYKMEALYREAGKVIEQATLKKGGIKGLCFQSNYSNKKKLFALVCQAVKYKSIIDTLLEKIDKDDITNEIDDNTQLVLAYDILFGRGIRCGGKIGRFARTHKKNLFDLLEEYQKNERDSTKDVNQLISLPRYVRVNTLKNTTNQVIDELKDEGWSLVDCKEESLEEDEFCLDPHVQDLLVFSPHTDFHQHPLYCNGQIFLQDKASCLPALLLKPKPSSTVIDACAAPGNKTTHLSALMQNQGKIFAFDMDFKRLKLLKEQLSKAGTENVEAMHQDFLKIKVNDEKYQNVKYILLDPSCSGSGMVSRMDQLLSNGATDEAKLQSRLEALSKFQYAMLCHALSFPNAKKVAYSTCSVHEQENERVVKRALQRFSTTFKLKKLMPSWEHRGLSSFDCGPYCLRASPEVNKTNGFFVALFKRRKQKTNEDGDPVTDNNERTFDIFDNETITESKKSRKRKKSNGSFKDEFHSNQKKKMTENSYHVKNNKSNNGKQKKRRKKHAKVPVTSL